MFEFNLSTIHYFFSTLSQVWAALVVVGVVVIRESIQFHETRMMLCFQMCVNVLKPFKPSIENFERRRTSTSDFKLTSDIFENQESMNDFLSNDGIKDKFFGDEGIPPTGNQEEDEANKNVLDRAIEQNSAYNSHKSKSVELRRSLKLLFINASILILASLMMVACSEVLTQKCIAIIVFASFFAWSIWILYLSLEHIGGPKA